MSVAPAGVTNVLVSISGVLQDPSTYGVVGNTITFSAAPPTGTGNISCRYLGVPVTGVTTTAYRTVTEFTATASQTTFTPPSYTVGFINVYLNGVLLGSADYTATNGTTVVLATGASAGNLVTVESFLVSSVLNAIPNTAGAVSSANLTDGSVTQAKLGSVYQNNGPAFSVYFSGSASTAAGFTAIPYDTETFDTASCFNNTGSTVGGIPAYSFKPTVAGYYQFTAAAFVNLGAVSQRASLSIFKNGSEALRGTDLSNSYFQSVTTGGLLYLNGTTDYVGVTVYLSVSGGPILAGSFLTYFNGCLLRGA
jgi:hypothetical protein